MNSAAFGALEQARHGANGAPLPLPACPSSDADKALVIDADLPPLRAAFVWPSLEQRQDAWRTSLFRREFVVTTRPRSRRILITADNRYILWLNGRRIGRGPLKGTLARYHAETYELADLLLPGRNVLAAEVRWWGEQGPISEVHGLLPGFLVQEFDGDELDTPGAWLARPDESVSPQKDHLLHEAQIFLGPLDRVDARLRPARWQCPDFDASGWSCPVPVPGLSHTQGWGLSPSHRLHARRLPALTEVPREFLHIFVDRSPIVLPWRLDPGISGEAWLQADVMTTSYPVFAFEGGADRVVEIVYAEALGQWTGEGDNTQWRKSGPRDDLARGEPHGYRDILVLPGGEHVFEPFHWRTFRFIKLLVGAGDSPVTLRAAHHRYTAFPQEMHARFDCADPDTSGFWVTSIRTLHLCAHETYEDCPYFEQLNYVADARIQALCSQYLANDTRLGRQGLLYFRDSLDASGLVASRAPARGRQVIPHFSLHWILMLGDYWRWLGHADASFVRESLPAVDAVLCHFRDRLTPEGFVGRIDAWAWIDWVPEWPEGVAPCAAAGAPSTFLTALFALAIEAALELHNGAGNPFEALRWSRLQKVLLGALRTAWSESAGCFHEGPGRESDPLTEHTQSFAILAGAPSASQLVRLRTSLAETTGLIPMSLMHRFYLVQALARLGRLDRLFPDVLSPWRAMLANGLTTWQEMADPTRSDCHAWSSWPVIVFLREVLGIRPGAPGWTSIHIAPGLDATSHASGAIDTPVGRIRTTWTVRPLQNRLDLTVHAPDAIPVTVTLPGAAPLYFPNGGGIALNDLPLPPFWNRPLSITKKRS